MATLLTPPGTAAVATIALQGDDAVSIAASLFSKSLPPAGQFRFGTFLGDDVVLAVLEDARVEIHCHGGRGVIEMILDELQLRGAMRSSPTARLVEQASTLRVAGILLDQMHGAFARSSFEDLDRLAALASLGEHLIAPWKVVIAGAPNAGKSSLINALAGYERAVVSPLAGTTRDAVSTVVAFDGWPVELTDTAGLRASVDVLEAAGIDRSREALAAADVIVWVLDATAPIAPIELQPHLIVVNKIDLAAAVPNALPVSAKTGAGIAALISAIVRVLVPVPPLPGEAVPCTPVLAATIRKAHRLAATGNTVAARNLFKAAQFQTV